MKPRRGFCVHRRTFLKLSGACGAACLRLSSAPWSGIAIASTLPLPFPHHAFPNPETLLARRRPAFDLLLVPAYAAVELIRRQALQPLVGPPGRAHDPDGTFTIPYAWAVGGLLYTGDPPQALDDLWRRPSLWPDSPRLVIGAALLRRGYPLNDTHPDHLAQVEQDLLQLRPRIVPDPAAGLRMGLAALALAVAPSPSPLLARSPTSRAGEESHAPPSLAGKGDGALGLARQPHVGVMLPPEGAAWLEYDWVIPLGRPNREAVFNFLANTPHAVRPPEMPQAPRLIPLTPLPTAASNRYAEIWARVAHRQSPVSNLCSHHA